MFNTITPTSFVCLFSDIDKKTRMLADEVKYSIEQDTIDVDECKTFAPFKIWMDRMRKDDKLVLKHVIFNSVSRFGPRIGFIKITTETMHVDTQHTVPGIVFLRGDAVAILVVLKCDGKEYTILTHQPRVPIGASGFLEIPAGMVDGDRNVKGKAIAEMEEETGIIVTADALYDMGKHFWPEGVYYPSVGASDEALSVFLFQKQSTQAEIAELEGKLTGESVHEHIRLNILPLDDVMTLPDSKSQIAYHLYRELGRRGELPKLE